jgi:hypothetical protein
MAIPKGGSWHIVIAKGGSWYIVIAKGGKYMGSSQSYSMYKL